MSLSKMEFGNIRKRSNGFLMSTVDYQGAACIVDLGLCTAPFGITQSHDKTTIHLRPHAPAVVKCLDALSEKAIDFAMQNQAALFGHEDKPRDVIADRCYPVVKKKEGYPAGVELAVPDDFTDEVPRNATVQAEVLVSHLWCNSSSRYGLKLKINAIGEVQGPVLLLTNKCLIEPMEDDE